MLKWGPRWAQMGPRSDFSEIVLLSYMLFNMVMVCEKIFEEFSMIFGSPGTLKIVLPCKRRTHFRDFGLPR